MKTSFFLIFLIPICLWAQSHRENKIIEDINQDGYIDTLFYTRDMGSGFSFRLVSLKNGKTQERLEIQNEYCHCQIKDVVYFPPALAIPENELFLQKIIETAFSIQEHAPDLSLQWIIQSSASIQKLEAHSLFDLILNPKTVWTSGEWRKPFSYKLKLAPHTFNLIRNTLYDVPNWFDPEKHLAYLFYNGHNHFDYMGIPDKSTDSLTFVTANQDFQIFQTKHGIVVKKGTLSKWVFISDLDLTGAPEKLRWESIEKVVLYDHYLFIHQTLPPTALYHVYVANIESGKLGRFKFEFPDHGQALMRSFELEGDTIWLNVEGERKSFKLKEVFGLLDNL